MAPDATFLTSGVPRTMTRARRPITIRGKRVGSAVATTPRRAFGGRAITLGGSLITLLRRVDRTTDQTDLVVPPDGAHTMRRDRFV